MVRHIVAVGDMLDDFELLHYPPFSYSVAMATAMSAVLFDIQMWQIIGVIMSAMLAGITALATVLRIRRETNRAKRELERHEAEMALLHDKIDHLDDKIDEQ